MTRRSTRRAASRAVLSLLVFGVALGVALGAIPARADEATADSAKASAEVAKAADQGKAEEAKANEKSKKSKVTREKSKEKAKQAKAAKGGSVTEGTKAAVGTMPVKPAVEPQHVQVQHILIAFAGSGTRASRPMEEAKKLAYEILARAQKGEDYDALVKQYTDDSPPGIYGMSGLGVAKGAGEYARDTMVPAFGNVGFAISPGNIGIADYDPQTSPYGWHIIKRLK
ncbi:MAG: peptidylprolyl isomerase [Candidatus Eisenbacteria bacterium]